MGMREARILLLGWLALFLNLLKGSPNLVAINQSWVASNQDLAMALLFGIGYAGIIFEESLTLNKSGLGLLMAVSFWVIRSIRAPSIDIAVSELSHASAEVNEIVFFLLGVMTIVEMVDVYQGFELVTDNIPTCKPRTLLWVVGFVIFSLSSILDNLTFTIVMVSLLRKLVPPLEYRKLLGAVVVIAANAGGAWTHIGDITTIMIWIYGQISTVQTMKVLIFPSVVSLAVPLTPLSFTQDSEFWQLVAYCASTGGSMLVIGSAAGVAFMENFGEQVTTITMFDSPTRQSVVTSNRDTDKSSESCFLHEEDDI